MPIIATNQWLTHYVKNKIGFLDYDLRLQNSIFSKNLSIYFPHTWDDQIHRHLLQNGLFSPDPSDENTIQLMHDKNFWEIAEAELIQLRNDWNGPDIPVFLLPLNIKNEKLRVDLGGKSGLAHQDKMFLFVSNTSSEKDLQVLITHEYNHVCRLNYLNQAEKNISLLDAMILEGLAELAVLERFEKGSLAKWTSIYPIEEAFVQWEKNFRSNLHVKKANAFHTALMYGNETIPKWMGYNIGFHLVTSFAKNANMGLEQIMRSPSKSILRESGFGN